MALTPEPIHVDTAPASTIVHFGVGGFHRAHQAVYLDMLHQRGLAAEWSICGAGVLENDRAIRDVLESQDFEYHVVECAPDGSQQVRSVRAITEFILGPEDPRGLIARLADPHTRIVSLTVTEGGYNVDDATGEFDLTTPAIAADLRDPAHPRTVFGFLTEALRLRRDDGVAPFTVMSCDNIQSNGEVARRAVVTFATAVDPKLGAWIDSHVAFPSGMVDRITPATTDAHRHMLAQDHGIQDAWPVVCEDFSQWVLEDSFTLGRPPFEQVGVQLVDDVRPYEKLKLRMLNGSHQAIAYAGLLRGHEFVHEAVEDPHVRELVRTYLAEAALTLDPVEGINPDDYAQSLISRFSNTYIKDTLLRLATDTSDRIPKFVVPVIVDSLKRGDLPSAAIAVLATWARCLDGPDEQGRPISLTDRRRVVPENGTARESLLLNQEVCGGLQQESALAAEFDRLATVLTADGVEAMVSSLRGA